MSQQRINLSYQRNKVLIASDKFFKAEAIFSYDVMSKCDKEINEIYDNIYERYGIDVLCNFHNKVIDGAEIVLHKSGIPIPKDLIDKMSECCQSMSKGTIYYGL